MRDGQKGGFQCGMVRLLGCESLVLRSAVLGLWSWGWLDGQGRGLMSTLAVRVFAAVVRSHGLCAEVSYMV